MALRKKSNVVCGVAIALVLTPLLLSGGCFGSKNKERVFFRELGIPEINELKKKPCVLFHVWATWCTVCVKELPEVIKMLETLKNVEPVVIDVSTPFMQENFSKKWLKVLSPSFLVFLKPQIDDSGYLDAIDKDGWGGGLPYTLLFMKGEKKMSWRGELNLNLVKTQLMSQCK